MENTEEGGGGADVHVGVVCRFYSMAMLQGNSCSGQPVCCLQEVVGRLLRE